MQEPTPISQAGILVVDDEPAVAATVGEFLEELGHEVRVAASAEEALAALENWHPDAVLTDLNLPGANGLDVVRAVKERDSECCVIIMTGQASTETAIHALRHGAYDYVRKPFNLIDLRQTLEHGIQARRLAQMNRTLVEELKAANQALQRHEQELQRKVQVATWQMKTLFELSTKMARTLNLDFRLNFVCEKAAELTGARRCLLFLHREESDDFAARAAYGVDDSTFGTLRFAAGEGLNGVSVAQSTVIRRVGPGLFENGDGSDGGPLASLGPQSVLIVPLVTEQRVMGTVNVLDKAGGFTQEDEDFLTLFAGSAAIALDNAILHARTLELDRLKSEFVAVVSHEIRTPLTVIKGSLELLADDRFWSLEDKQAQLLGGAQANCERLMLLINDILDFSKLEASTLPMTFARGALEEVLEAATSNLETVLAQQEVRIVERVPEDLPPVVMDEQRIGQVVTNLISNAVKFSPVGAAVTVSARIEDEEVVISVKDEGEGIAPENMNRLFKRFSQIDSSSTRRVGGTGLGLVICKGIVEAHEGRIWAESEVGRGSTFAFALPVAGPANQPGTVGVAADGAARDVSAA